MRHPLRGLPRANFRLVTPDDAAFIAENFSPHFFEEAGFSAFAELDVDTAIEEVTKQIKLGLSTFILAEIDGKTVGFIGYAIERVFTIRPIAMMFFHYVVPEHRKGPLGRLLLAFAMDMAGSVDECCAFFSVVAPTSPAARGLCNLYRRSGFQPMGGAFMKGL
jgi:GNAT superfamily N-acetyltransferase